MNLIQEVDLYNKRLDNFHMNEIIDKRELLKLINLSKEAIYDILEEKSWVEVFNNTWKQKHEIKEILSTPNYI